MTGLPVATPSAEPLAPVPAALAPYAHPDQVRTPWPVLLHAGGCTPLSDVLEQRVGAGVLADNLKRLERAVRREVPEGGTALAASAAIRDAGRRVHDELALAEAPAKQLRAAVDTLAAAMGADLLCPYGPDAALHLVLHAARDALVARRERLWAEVRDVLRGLRDLLDVERSYTASPTSDGLMGRYLDAGVMPGVVGDRRGTVAMPDERRKRIEGLVALLAGAAAADPIPVLTLVHGAHRPITWTGAAGVLLVPSQAPEVDAAAVFDREAGQVARVLDALRSARLELAGKYDAATHDALRQGFDWSAFTVDELLLLPPVVALLDDVRAVGEGMTGLSRLLASVRTVQVVVEVCPSRNPGAAGDPLSGYRVEPGMVALAHRQTFVQQSTPARPEHLYAGARRAFERGRPGVHLVAGGHDVPSPVGAWMRASAAVAARALPLFHYDPAAGETWAECMAVDDNPSPELDWPDQGDGDPFTFADFALLDPALQGHFRPATPAETRVASVSAWLQDLGASGTTPVVRAVGGGAYVPSAALLEACIDRRRTWRALRELGGVGNEHARRAAAAARAEAEAAAAATLEAARQEHAAELERVRRDTAGEAMRRLAASLLDTDLSAAAPVARATPRPTAPVAPAAAPAPAPAAAAAPAPTPAPAVEEEVADEAWVDSMLCTSCNDCTLINPLLFVYDDNKQVRIGDLSKGTYAQLVAAAEKCPARCIHPGAPSNPNEPGVAALVARAAPFR